MTTAEREVFNRIEVSLSVDLSVLGGLDFLPSIILLFEGEELDKLHSSELSSVEMYSDDSAWL